MKNEIICFRPPLCILFRVNWAILKMYGYSSCFDHVMDTYMVNIIGFCEIKRPKLIIKANIVQIQVKI